MRRCWLRSWVPVQLDSASGAVPDQAAAHPRHGAAQRVRAGFGPDEIVLGGIGDHVEHLFL
jgi:hypothetical protein